MPSTFITPGQGAAPFLGIQRRLTVLQPAVGAEWSLTLPGGAWWRLLTARTTLTLSAAAGNRFPGIALLDGAAILYRSGSTSAFAPSTAGDVNYVTGAPIILDGGNGGRPSVALPAVILPAGYIVQSHTVNRDAGDQYGAVEMLWDEIDLGPYGGEYGSVYYSPGPTTGEEG